MISRDSAILGRTRCTTENRGVPGSSPGLAMAETRMGSRLPVFRVRGSGLEIGARSGPELGLGPENSLRGPIGRARALIDTGVSRRLESNRPRFPSLWCRVRVGTPRSANPAQPRWQSTGSCPSSQSGKQESGEADARCCCTSKARAHGRPPLGRSHARRRSGPESPEPLHALLHSNASVSPRRARRAAGGTPRPRPPATRQRQCVAAEQLRGDDGARLRLLLPQRSGREVRASRDACSSS